MSLSGDAHSRYKTKVLTARLTKDHYSIMEWVEEPSVIPNITWSDFMVHIHAAGFLSGDGGTFAPLALACPFLRTFPLHVKLSSQYTLYIQHLQLF